MAGRLIFILIGLTLFLGCSEEKRPFFRNGEIEPKNFVLEMQHFFSDSEDNMSFPVWFEDSLIKNGGVKTIHRKIYNLNEKVDDLSALKMEKIYEFDTGGRILSVQIREYYEGQNVSDVTFLYSGVKDLHGFQKVKMTRTIESKDEVTGYQLYDVEQTATNFWAYVNNVSGNYLFFLPNERHWGGLSVDSILSPTPEDVIVFGTPKVPTKRYQVVNRVNEFKVRTIDYAKKPLKKSGGNEWNPTEIRFESEPFDYKRNIEYDKKGNCIGFVDSTFSMERYLMRRWTRFKFNKIHLPTEVVHTSAQTANTSKNRQIETFDYIFYE